VPPRTNRLTNRENEVVGPIAGGKSNRAIGEAALPHDVAASISSGTITFIFTDIEGSTQRWDRDRAAMEAAVRRHDVLMREAIAAHNGHDPDNNSIIFTLELLALIDALQDRFPRAARLVAYTDSAFAKLGTKRRRVSQMTYDRLTALLDARLTPEDRAHLAAEGAALTPEAAVTLALEREGRE
jgi:class 3 adenylate cyclase